jgi:predicted regulator of Ras-like GTPase activity (Roadblock/LC7/MglB family)
MYEVLAELNRTTGVTGSMIVGHDGIPIAADLPSKVAEDTVGAMAASIVGTARKSLERLEQTPMTQTMIESENGKLFLANADIGILVVTTEKQVNIGLVRIEIRNAVAKLRSRH